MTSAVVFVDAQNLTNSLRRAFKVKMTNFDLIGLSNYICAQQGWELGQIRYYTGLPSAVHEPVRHEETRRRLSKLGRQGVHTWSRRMSYVTKSTTCSCLSEEIDCNCDHVTTKLVGREKGVDMRIALDAVSLTVQGNLDVAVFFTQDQDFNEVAETIKEMAAHVRRQITVASVFPLGEQGQRSGVRGTQQIPYTAEEFAPFRRG